jgi:membrane protein YdbS with pleckstrin-like domain
MRVGGAPAYHLHHAEHGATGHPGGLVVFEVGLAKRAEQAGAQNSAKVHGSSQTHIIAEAPMQPLVIKSTAKTVMAWLLFSTVLLVGIAAYLYTRNWEPRALLALFVLPLGIDSWVAWRLVQLQNRRMILSGDLLRFEEGFLRRTQRTLMLAKIEDVRVEQSLGQRLLGVGHLTVLATGDSTPLRLDNIDNARGVADRILNAAQAARKP